VVISNKKASFAERLFILVISTGTSLLLQTYDQNKKEKMGWTDSF
jgi:hypothetical protein